MSILSSHKVAQAGATSTSCVWKYSSRALRTCLAYLSMQVMDLFGRVQYFKFKGDDLKQCLSGDFRDGTSLGAYSLLASNSG